MAIQELTPASAAQQQLDSYNRAGGAVGTNSFSLPAGAAWAVVGTVVADAVVIGDVPTLEADIEALAQVTAASPLHWGQAPATIQAADHETVLVVEAKQVETIDLGGGKSQVVTAKMRPSEFAKPPLGKKFIVWGLRVPAALDQSGIAALKTALEGVTGITTAHHQVDGAIDAEATAATVRVGTHVRIDPTEAP